MSMNDTPRGERVVVAFFGLRNAGKSTLVNAVAGQEVAIVSDVAGTTTDPVSKAMEILPLGPCMLVDTAGLDDVGPLGEERVRRSLKVLETADIAVWVVSADSSDAARETEVRARFVRECARFGVQTLEFRRGEDVESFRARLAAVAVADVSRPLVADLVEPGDVVVCVCPIDGSAPRGRLILPQQQVIRELLDRGAAALVCQCTEDLPRLCSSVSPRFVITDSQAFAAVTRLVPPSIPVTSFSIVFARAKGDLAAYVEGAAAMRRLADGDRVLIAEGCTHRRQCGDIGTVKLPRWIGEFTGRSLEFDFVSGGDFPMPPPPGERPYSLVVQCGGCMLTRREVQRRIARCREAGVPIVNYGICIAVCHGIEIVEGTCMVRRTTPEEKPCR